MSVLVGVSSMVSLAPGAHAANVGSVTVSYDASAPLFVSFTPTSLTGTSGDTFTFVNNRYNSVTSYISIANDTGSVTLDGVPCTTSTSCTVGDFNPPPRSEVVAIITPGTFTIYRSTGGAPTNIGTLTISSGTAVIDPALVYPTLNLNANGGNCTGNMQFIKRNGENATVALPTSTACSRTNYSLLGWARSASASVADFTSSVPIGDESFNLFAVWQPDGIAVTYDSNVGMNTPCLINGVDASTIDDRSVTKVITPSSSGEALAWDSKGVARWASTTPKPVCAPEGFIFDGWSTTGTDKARNGGQVNDVITGFTKYPSGNIPFGSAVTLFARWIVNYGVTVSVPESTMKKNTVTTATVTATRNGSPVPNAQVKVVTSGGATLANNSTSATLTTDSDGRATTSVHAQSSVGSATIYAAFGDNSASASISITAPVEASIVITGERTNVSGKPGIRIDGIVSGLADGTKLKPWFRFPGESKFVEGSARLEVINGEFTWQRKTGKKFYAYVTTEDESVQSNRVIIPAN